MMDGPLEVEYKPSQVGKEQLTINGCEYVVNRRSGNIIYWRCTFPLCHSSAVLKDGQIMSVRGTHTCSLHLQKKSNEESQSTNQQQQLNNNPSLLNKGVPMPLEDKSLNEEVPILPLESPIEEAPMMSTSETDPETHLKMYPIFCKPGLVKLPRPKIILESQNGEFSPPANKVPKAEERGTRANGQPNQNSPKKTSPLKNQVVVKSAKELEEERRLQEVREAWTKNKTYFIDKFIADEEKLKTSNIIWSCCCTLERPGTRGLTMTMPIKGTGVKVEQEEVPIRVIDHVEPLEKDSDGSSSRDELEDSPTIVIENQGKRKGDSDLECHVAHKRKRDEMEEIDESDKYLQSFKVHCNGMKLFECNDCNETFPEEDSYLTHLKVKHGIQKPWFCDKCPMSFEYKSWLNRHLQSRTCGKSFRCVPCMKKFRNAKFLEQHNRKCHQITSGVLLSGTTFTEGLRKRKASLESDDEEVTSQMDSLHSNQSMNSASKNSFVKNEVSLDNSQDCEPGPSEKPVRPFTLEELKYVDFLQPKVVLSKDLSNFLERRPLPRPAEPIAEPARVSPDHTYAISPIE